ncbi:hypothetical protein IFM89_029471 [Coptis chinensis]|uniref:Uncharacterized protein n=1 Tax=Coptis chinensis TaxID=261450 RepID=A0A835HYS1_9MAGN|nr:hypothetical protein IFM89_029471 [Coptis chinensis]
MALSKGKNHGKMSYKYAVIYLSTTSVDLFLPTFQDFHVCRDYKSVWFSMVIFLRLRSLENNSLSGVVPSTVWRNRTFNATESLLL